MKTIKNFFHWLRVLRTLMKSEFYTIITVGEDKTAIYGNFPDRYQNQVIDLIDDMMIESEREFGVS